MFRMRHLLVSLAALASQTTAWSEKWQQDFGGYEVHLRGHQPLPGRDAAVSVEADSNQGSGFFKQLIDHNDPSKGTFDQFYYWSNEFWKGPGSPVFLFTPGEINATEYTAFLTNKTSTGVMAQQVGGAIFVLEHRYWGQSSPYPDLTTANLQYLTLDNAIHDLTYFANQISSPWSSNVSITAKDAPWVLTGGSYSGALSAWTESVAPGTFWAYHATSAPVEAISDFAAYFYPVQEGMAKNCSSDINLVMNYMDKILGSDNQTAITELKTMFMLQDVEHNDDFMAALENGPWLWQGNQFYTGYSPFFQFCDYVENAVNSTGNVSASGVGLEKALQGYADWFTQSFLPDYCYQTFGYADFNGTYNTACFNTYNASSPLFADTSLSNQIDRQWNWMLCNEPFGYWQDGAPANQSTLVSRLVDVDYWVRQCSLFFPEGPNGETYGLANNKTEAEVNVYTQGWEDRNSTRLIYANGGYDPWRESGVSASIRPGGPAQSTTQIPINIIPGGFHCSDLSIKNAEANAGVQTVLDAEVKQIADWVGQWSKPQSSNRRAVRWTA